MELDDLTKDVKIDCLKFKGYIPCKPHKEKGAICSDCKYYEPSGKKILILKLGAAGEVLRNTPLLRKIKQEYPNPKIFWLTEYPELVPEKEVYKICDFNNKELELIKNIDFDILYSLDKHEETGALANIINSKIKKGFSQVNGEIVPFDKDTIGKWERGFRDDLMKKNKKHYVEEIFEICGFEFNGEKYLLPEFTRPDVDIDENKKVVALNTGLSDIWKPRVYSNENWIALSKKLLKNNYEVVIFRGPKEDEKNRIIAKESGAKYFGKDFKYRDSIGLLDYADVVVTGVSFGLHAAVGLEKKVVLLNNVFNKHEFYLYDRGIILEPEIPCKMCYKLDFDDKCYTKNCMDLIKPEQIFQEVEKLSS